MVGFHALKGVEEVNTRTTDSHHRDTATCIPCIERQLCVQTEHRDFHQVQTTFVEMS